LEAGVEILGIVSAVGSQGISVFPAFSPQSFQAFSICQHPTVLALQAVALGLYPIFSSSLCSRRVDSQAGFRAKAVSSNTSVSGDVDVR
jgi:hypothetical protein